MKAPKLIKKTTVTLFALLILSCGAETLALIFIPAFAATWNVEGDQDYRIDLQPDNNNKNVPAGVFEGEEIHDSNDDLNGNPLSGSFSGLDIEFTIQRDNHVEIQYVGKMQTVSDTDHTVTRIVLHSSEGSLVLIQ
jgi:hypothetical protein